MDSPGAIAEMGALFPELASGPGVGGIAVWAGARGTARLRARAASVGVPFALLGHGLLRAPPRGRAPPPCLSALALEISGPGSPPEIVTPDRVLGERGAAGAGRLGAPGARVGARRRRLVATRCGWNAGWRRLRRRHPHRPGKR